MPNTENPPSTITSTIKSSLPLYGFFGGLLTSAAGIKILQLSEGDAARSVNHFSNHFSIEDKFNEERLKSSGLPEYERELLNKQLAKKRAEEIGKLSKQTAGMNRVGLGLLLTGVGMSLYSTYRSVTRLVDLGKEKADHPRLSK